MASILVRQVPEGVKRDLKRVAARNGNSLEGEIREMLVVRAKQERMTRTKLPKGLGTMLVEHFRGKVPPEFKIPPRKELPRPAKFDE